jgi:hypothetical protein
MVSELIDEEWGCWKTRLVNNKFNEQDAQEIFHIPLVNYGTNDEMIWRFEKRGIYTVKSAYRVCVDMILGRIVRSMEIGINFGHTPSLLR